MVEAVGGAGGVEAAEDADGGAAASTGVYGAGGRALLSACAQVRRVGCWRRPISGVRVGRAVGRSTGAAGGPTGDRTHQYGRPMGAARQRERG